MPYVKKGTRPGRPKVHAPGHEPRSIGLRLPRPLFTTLETVAKAQRTSITAVALQALEHHLHMPQLASQLDVMDHSLTQAVKKLCALEALLTPDDPRYQHLDAAFQALGDIDAALNHLLQKDLTHENA